MLTSHEWRLAIEATAGEVLRQVDWPGPPVDAIRLAKTLQLTVAWAPGQPARGRIQRIAGRSTIFLKPEDRPERIQWAAAHEIGENLAWKVCAALDVDGPELTPRQREELANQLARELLLPAPWFRRDCFAVGFQLDALKTRYGTASHDLIAWRWLDLDIPGVVTIFDQGVLTQRRGNLPGRTPPLSPAERDCWSRLRNTRQPAIAADGQQTLRGWCIDSPGWQREILYAQCTDAEE